MASPTSRFWGPAGLVCHIDAVTGATVYYHADEQGSTLALTDGSGNVSDQFAYTPYGELTGRSGTTSTPYQWLGGSAVRADDGPNVYAMQRRFYSADQKRFLSADPKGIDGWVNLYAYGNLNPIIFTDPYGLWATGSYWGDVGQVFTGYGWAARNTGMGFYNVAVHPINTAVGVTYTVTHPVQAYDTFKSSVINTWNSGPQGQGEIVGNVLIAAASIGAGEAIASTRAAQITAAESSFGAFATDTAGLSRAQLLAKWEVGSAALNDANFAALGGNGTSALFKAPYIQNWVDTAGNPLTSTYGQQLSTGAKLFSQGSGLTPNAYLGLGRGLPVAGLAGNVGNAGYK